MKNIPYYEQETVYTCGAAAMRMALAGLGIKKSEKAIAKLLATNTRVGTRHRAFPAAAEALKLQYIVRRNADMLDVRRALNEGYIVITCYYLTDEKVSHYAVVKRVTRDAIHLLDPAYGKNRAIARSEFIRLWDVMVGTDREYGWFFGVKRS